MTDFLETRSMNLNVRVSPQTKRQLTDKAQQLGLNMTDYIYVVIAKSEAVATDLEMLNAEKSKLEQHVRQLQANLANAKKEAESNVATLNTGKTKIFKHDKFVEMLQAYPELWAEYSQEYIEENKTEPIYAKYIQKLNDLLGQ